MIPAMIGTPSKSGADPFLTGLGERVRFFRRERGLTQQQLAELSHRKLEVISHVERGLRYTKLDTLVDIATALNVNVRDLIPDAATPESEADQLRADIVASINKLDIDMLRIAATQIRAFRPR